MKVDLPKTTTTEAFYHAYQTMLPLLSRTKLGMRDLKIGSKYSKKQIVRFVTFCDCTVCT